MNNDAVQAVANIVLPFNILTVPLGSPSSVGLALAELLFLALHNFKLKSSNSKNVNNSNTIPTICLE